MMSIGVVVAFKLLVLGDSFAKFDDIETHWAYQWLLPYGGTTQHMGEGGASAVTVINHFEDYYKNKSLDFDGVIFQVPDFYRTEAVIPKFDDSNSIPNLELFDACFSHPDLLNHSINGNDDTANVYSALPRYFSKYRIDRTQLMYYLSAIDPSSEVFKYLHARDISESNILNTSKKLYSSISPRWLIRANYQSLKYFNLLMKENNKPVCFVFNPGVGLGTFKYIKEYFTNLPNVWFMDIKSDNIGENHVPLASAIECGKSWDNHNKNTGIFAV